MLAVLYTVQDTAFCTAAGLMMLDMLLLPTVDTATQAGQPNAGFFGTLDCLLKRVKR